MVMGGHCSGIRYCLFMDGTVSVRRADPLLFYIYIYIYIDGPTCCCRPSDCSSCLKGEEWKKRKKGKKRKHTVALFIPDVTVHGIG
jgi:hypothetical protein